MTPKIYHNKKIELTIVEFIKELKYENVQGLKYDGL